MKLQKAKRILINRCEIDLISGPDEEWLSDGLTAWRASEMGLTKDNVRAVMDITDKQILADNVRAMDRSDSEMWSGYFDAKKDIPLRDNGLVLVDGVEYRVLTALEPDERAPLPIYVREDYIVPVRHIGNIVFNLRVSEPDMYGDRLKLVTVLQENEPGINALIAPEGRGRKDDDSDRKYGADRIEERIKELFALACMSSIPEGVVENGN